MKINRFKLLSLLLLGLSFTACEINDPIDNVVRVGQQAPHIYWELPSSSVAAGEPVSFTAQYYTVGDGMSVDSLEAWYSINEKIITAVSCPLLSTFKFAMNTEDVTLSREFQKIQTYVHEDGFWNPLKKAYFLDSTFNTSNTLRSVEWKEVKEFDNQKFSTYFPAGFDQQFKDSLVKNMLVSDYRKMFISLGVMTDVEFKDCTDSTFNENSGSWDYSIKLGSIPLINSKYEGIAFKDLIYDPSAQLYKIEYQKSYSLDARIKAIDNKQVVGVSDKKTIELR